VPRRDTYVPKHRGLAPEPAVKKGIKKGVLLSGVAVATTGVAVTSGVLAQQDPASGSSHAALRTAPKLDRPAPSASDDKPLEGRDDRAASRSDRRDDDKSEKKNEGGKHKREEKKDPAAALANQDPRDIARKLLPKYGFSQSEFSCLDQLYVSESDWDPHADNPTSSAYGIPQALTETHDLPADYMTNPVTQIEWGLDYIRSSYGTPCSAWEFKQANNWY
jgi:hypothetical protein